ncbi:MAG: nucleotidyl transferase AbiEii/AbiGii toxin family protein, partial [Vicinamibacterales bacterium]
MASACRECNCRWYLFGAQAVIIWGRPRLTTDVDVTVFLGTIGTDTLVAALRRSAFRLQEEVSDEFVRVTRVLPLRHEPTGLSLDIVIGGPGLEERFLERAVLVDLDGVQTPVISPEDLIVTKVLAGRAKDLEDVRGVLA